MARMEVGPAMQLQAADIIKNLNISVLSVIGIEHRDRLYFDIIIINQGF